jgi:acetylornithine/N-succinyldiaminopimelate aminotransferase
MTNAIHPFDALMDITARPEVVFVRGEGGYLWDHTGKRYLDFVQGWAVNCLGHSPPAVAEALAAQAKLLLTPSPAFYNGPSLKLARALADNSCFDQVFFANSGGEANEGRDQARAQIRRKAQGRRVRDHHLRRRLPRPDARDHVSVGQEGV